MLAFPRVLLVGRQDAHSLIIPSHSTYVFVTEQEKWGVIDRTDWVVKPSPCQNLVIALLELWQLATLLWSTQDPTSWRRTTGPRLPQIELFLQQIEERYFHCLSSG